MHMDLRKLKIYGGNYDQFMKTRGEQVEAQMKQYNWEQDQIAHMKEYIARFVCFNGSCLTIMVTKFIQRMVCQKSQPLQIHTM